jgi:hypothetical protein
MENTVLVTGNTYAVKDQIKALGGRWDSAARGWRVPADKAVEAQTLAGPAATSSATASTTPARLHCRSCGQTGTRGAYPFSTLPGSGRCDDCV